MPFRPPFSRLLPRKAWENSFFLIILITSDPRSNRRSMLTVLTSAADVRTKSKSLKCTFNCFCSLRFRKCSIHNLLAKLTMNSIKKNSLPSWVSMLSVEISITDKPCVALNQCTNQCLLKNQGRIQKKVNSGQVHEWVSIKTPQKGGSPMGY